MSVDALANLGGSLNTVATPSPIGGKNLPKKDILGHF